jgi:hypothetical protein
MAQSSIRLDCRYPVTAISGDDFCVLLPFRNGENDMLCSCLPWFSRVLSLDPHPEPNLCLRQARVLEMGKIVD